MQNFNRMKIQTTRYKFLLQILISFFIYTASNAQQLNIGDKLEPLSLKHVFNYPDGEQLTLFSKKPKLTILDFWGHACKGCLESFPYLDSLQKQFAGELQVVLVNPESLDSTKQFLELRKHLLTKPDIPMVTGDTLLSQLFPHLSVPFYVWVDSTGTIRYQTGSDGLTADNISRFLNGQELNMSPYIGRLRYLPSLFAEDQYNSLVSFSYLGHADNSRSIGDGRGFKETNDLYRDYASVKDLFRFAYEENAKYNFRRPGRLILEVEDEYPYVEPTDKNKLPEWKRKYQYTYDLRVPEHLKEKKYELMQQDLDRYFDLVASIEERPLTAWVLVRTGKEDKLKTAGGDPKDTFDYHETAQQYNIRELLNHPYVVFSNRLSKWIEYRLGMPFVDKTEYEGNIDISMDALVLDFMDIDMLNSALKAFDLKLIERDVLVETLVLKKK